MRGSWSRRDVLTTAELVEYFRRFTGWHKPTHTDMERRVRKIQVFIVSVRVSSKV